MCARPLAPHPPPPHPTPSTSPPIHNTTFNHLPQVIHKVIIEHKRPELPVTLPYELTQLASDCWQHSADERPSFQQLVARLEDMQSRVEQLVEQAVLADTAYVVDF
jgi:hypothetical protein